MRFVFFVCSTLAMGGEYTTYIGDAFPRTVTAMTTDAAGNTYVTGNRGSFGVPTAVIYDPTALLSEILQINASTAPNDVFVSKIDPSGNILFTNTFAGKGVDQALAISVDPSGNIYVAGTTTSLDFPVTNALQSQPGQNGTGFIVKLSADGKTILYSSYFGGLQGPTSVNAMTTDASGNLYLTGTTSATDFPITSGMPSSTPPQYSVFFNGIVTGEVAFVAAISTAGDKNLFSGTLGNFGLTACPATPLGCAVQTTNVGLAVDTSRNVYFAGNTTSGVPTTSGAWVPKGLGAFFGKITANGTGLAYLTYLDAATELGPGYYEGTTQVSSLALDNEGNLYLAGNTGDPKFPVTPGAYQTAFSGNPLNQFGNPSNTDAYLAKLNPTGTAFIWATYLGGNGNDSISSIAVDAAGDVWATGTTASTNFPNANGWSQGGDFLVEFNPAGSALAYSACYPANTVSQAVALDETLLVHAAGATGILSTIASTAPPTRKIFGIGNAAGGLLAGRVSPAEVISIYGPGIGPATAVTAVPASGFYPTTLGAVQVSIGGMNMPLLFVSATQINAVVPMEVTTQTAATIQITNGAGTTPAFPVWIDSSDDMLFPGVLNQNGTLNSETNPAKASSVVTFYATGWQATFAPVADGQVEAPGSSSFAGPDLASQGRIVYEGGAPGIVAGVTQFNLQLNGGAQPVSVMGLSEVAIAVAGLHQFIFLWVTQ